MIVINLTSYTYVFEVREWVNCEVECLHPNTVGVNYQAGMAAILIWCDTEMDYIGTFVTNHSHEWQMKFEYRNSESDTHVSFITLTSVRDRVRKHEYISGLNNTHNPVCDVTILCQQVRCIYYQSFSYRQVQGGIMNQYRSFCMGCLSYRLIRVIYKNIFSVHICKLEWLSIIFAFFYRRNIETHCFYVWGYQNRHPYSSGSMKKLGFVLFSRQWSLKKCIQLSYRVLTAQENMATRRTIFTIVKYVCYEAHAVDNWGPFTNMD